MKEIQNLRVDYVKGELTERDAASDPFAQFAKWFNEATALEIPDVNAMAVATADARGTPSVRICLLKNFDEDGFTFFTNQQSRKGRELTENPKASLCFFWQPLERQVRIDGVVEPVSREDAKTYFQSRPIGSQIAASISHQSEAIKSRDELERVHAQLLAKHANDKAIELPDFWGGYRVVPSAIEFWQGRRSRLHDRLLYTRELDGKWSMKRLAP
ncbi:MAG: pyridoxamine 5'-phosphate oxidase [Anaerolineae bacterium]|nr:pyridoxamine 5'-phosphate oxidase [Phycisphaerae bacterium]